MTPETDSHPARRWSPATIAAAVLVPLALQFGLAGCASGGMGDVLPQGMGGLPEGAPARPTTTYQYPRVHDMPSDRPSRPLDDSEQIKLQRDLQNLRDQQGKLTADPAAPEAAKPASAANKPAASPSSSAKKPAIPAKPGQTSGAKTNP